MSIVVVVIQKPKPGRLDDALAALESVAPDVHKEKGCELYAAHTDGTHIVNVEQWATEADLQAHAEGAAVARLLDAASDALEDAQQLFILEPTPFGDLSKNMLR